MRIGDLSLPIMKEQTISLSMSLVIFLKQEDKIEATGDGMASDGNPRNLRRDFQKVYRVNNRAVIGYSSQTAINEHDLYNLTNTLELFSKISQTTAGIADILVYILRNTPEPHPDQVLIGGIDTQMHILKLERDNNWSPVEILDDHAFLGWTDIADSVYSDIQSLSNDIALDLIQITCDDPIYPGAVGGLPKRFIVNKFGIEEVELIDYISISN